MPPPRLTDCDPLVSGEGVNEAGVPIFRVIAVGFAVKFAVVQDTDALQDDAFIAIVQFVEFIVPEGPATGSQLSPSQALPGRQVTSTPGITES